MMKSALLVTLLAGSAYADTYRPEPGLGAGSTGYLAGYVDITSDCDAPGGSCSGSAQQHVVLLDAQGKVTSTKAVGGANDGGNADGTVVSAGDLGWLVELGGAPLFVASDGTSSAASPSLSTSTPCTYDYSTWHFVGDGWWSACIATPTLQHLGLDGSTLATSTFGTSATSAVVDTSDLGVRADGTMLVAWASNDTFYAQRFTSAGVALDDDGVALGPGTHANGPGLPNLRVTSTSAGWLVWTQGDEGDALAFVAIDGTVTNHALPTDAVTGLGMRFAEPTPTGALWFELDDSAFENPTAPLRVAQIGADGSGIGAALTQVTTIARDFSIAANDQGFVLLESQSDESLKFTALDTNGNVTSSEHLLGGCSTMPGSASSTSFGVGLVLLLTVLVRRGAAYAINRRAMMLPPARASAPGRSATCSAGS